MIGSTGYAAPKATGTSSSGELRRVDPEKAHSGSDSKISPSFAESHCPTWILLCRSKVLSSNGRTKC